MDEDDEDLDEEEEERRRAEAESLAVKQNQPQYIPCEEGQSPKQCFEKFMVLVKVHLLSDINLMLRASIGLLRLLMRFLDDEFLALFDKMQSENINETRSAGIGKSAMSKRGMEGRMELPIVNRIKSKQFTHLFHSVPLRLIIVAIK